jgi:hypothetical protein
MLTMYYMSRRGLLLCRINDFGMPRNLILYVLSKPAALRIAATGTLDFTPQDGP